MAPVLEKFLVDSTLFPALYRLEMMDTDIKENIVEEFLDSRVGPLESGRTLASIREAAFYHCSRITRGFCDRVKEKVEKLTIYCWFVCVVVVFPIPCHPEG